MYSAIVVFALTGCGDVPSSGAAGPGQCTVYYANPSHGHFWRGHGCHGHGWRSGLRHHGCHNGYAVNYGCAGVSVPPPKSPDGVKKAEGSGSPAQIVVRLPADARLFVDDAPTQSTSGQRLLVTPTLPTGESYAYTLRVEVNRQGRTVADTRTINVTAGQSTSISFEDTSTVRQSSAN
jgi:uncharacterized protein (TIGR03000 family)